MLQDVCTFHYLTPTHARKLTVRIFLFSDTNSLIPGLQGCCRLKTLTIEGNPVHEDPDCR